LVYLSWYSGISLILKFLFLNMRIKAIYKKNLKMSEGKVAAQIAHAVKNLGITPIDCDIIVLKVSDKKFDELVSQNDCYIQTDKGLTEVETGTQTAAAWIETK
jgi:peptidyl-tRNA hydrolase